MTDRTAAEIAAGLTADEEDMVLSLSDGRVQSIAEHASPCQVTLAAAGVLSTARLGHDYLTVHLTRLGRAVAAVLEANNDD